MQTNTAFTDSILSLSHACYSPQRFPLSYLDKKNDCLEILFADDAYNGERIDGRVTIYRSIETRELVGVLIKGLSIWVSRILQHFPGVSIDLQAGKFKFGLFFQLEQFVSTDPHLQLVYKQLYAEAERFSFQLDSNEIFSERTTKDLNSECATN